MATEVLADEAALRAARRARALEQMEANDIDALLLGREANTRYVAGAQRLWTAGTRPFGPGCVVVRSTGAIHLVSTWDEGIPEDIPRAHLFGITWNPGHLLAWLGQIEGLGEARRIGTDSLTPRFATLLPKVFPTAEFVDAEPALEGARRIKTPEEIDAIRVAVRVAEAALAAAVDAVAPGTTERALTGVFMESMAGLGVTTPATQRVARIAGDLVTFDAGVVAGGYTGEVGRTWPLTTPAEAADLFCKTEDLWSRLIAAGQPGQPATAFLDAYRNAGVPLPARPIVTGLGLGFDGPVIAAGLEHTAAQETLTEGMVLAVTAVSGPVMRKDAVLITVTGPELLTSSPVWKQAP
jgi:Xaa-Pro aminopeptidase